VAGGIPARQRDLRAQGRRTVERLLDAGLRTFRRLGYPATRVDDIVRAARTSHGTFYLYFASKEDLLGALALDCAQQMEDLAASLGPIGPGPDGRAELERWLRGFTAVYRRYGPVIRAWSESQVGDAELAAIGTRSLRAITAKLVERIGQAAPAPGIDPEPAAFAAVAMLERFNYFALSRRLGFDDEDVVTTLATILHAGMFGAAARRRGG